MAINDVLQRVVSPRIYVGPRLGAVVLAVWQVPNRSAVAVDVPVQARYLEGSVVSEDRPRIGFLLNFLLL